MGIYYYCTNIIELDSHDAFTALTGARLPLVVTLSSNIEKVLATYNIVLGSLPGHSTPHSHLDPRDLSNSVDSRVGEPLSGPPPTSQPH